MALNDPLAFYVLNQYLTEQFRATFLADLEYLHIQDKFNFT